MPNVEKKTFTLSVLAGMFDAVLDGPGDAVITGVSGVEQATPE